MTLQYNVRSMGEDRIWQLRIRLSGCLLLETVDWWCSTDAGFPIDDTVASVLFLFSPRCYPLTVPEMRVRQHLLNIVGTPTAEYSQTWPSRTDGEKAELINAISRILSDAVNRWNGGLLESSIELVNQQIVDELAAQRYVTFHHHRTTRRDYGGLYGSG